MTESKQHVIELIRSAFKGVVLGEGVGLKEGQGHDGGEGEAICEAYRDKDEKNDWEAIPVENLNVCSSSLSFFDAEGMRFHLPAFLVADLEGKLGVDPVFHLVHLDDYARGKLALLSPAQRAAIRQYLLFVKDDPNFEFDRPNIEWSLETYWTTD